MSSQQQKQIANLQDSLLLHSERLQEQENLLNTIQSKNPKDKQSKSSRFQSNQKQTEDQDQTANIYVKQENLKIQADLEDFNDLEDEIQRLKKIKNQYKEQKQSIQKLSKVVETLKSENRSLKLQKESNRDQSARKNPLHEFQRNIDSKEKLGKRILTQNGIKGNIVNTNFNQKPHTRQNFRIQSFMSPQPHRRILSNSLKNLGHLNLSLEENYVSDMLQLDQKVMLKNHQQNKKSVIASFVEELKQELEQNEIILQRQRKCHRQTRQRLEVCLQELADFRSMFDRQRNCDVIERQNIQLKKQLELETEQRLMAEERFREKENLSSQYEAGLTNICTQFDRQLDKMDEIYFSLERTLKF